jgi:hypothetical protein
MMEGETTVSKGWYRQDKPRWAMAAVLGKTCALAGHENRQSLEYSRSYHSRHARLREGLACGQYRREGESGGRQRS